MRKISAVISAVGGFVPDYALTNQILETMVETNDKRIIDATAKRMNLPKEKVMINIHKYGITTSATLPRCLVDYEKQFKKEIV